MNDLLATAKTFDAETKKMFKSCKFAALNVSGPRDSWTAWGDFKRRADAQSAISMWGLAFRKGVTVSVEGKYYRVVAKV